MTERTADDESGVKRHVGQRSTWVRLIYMLILALAWTIAEFVFIAVAVLQFLATLLTGRPMDNLVHFGRDLAEYMAAIVRFETFVTEELTFPFTSWPSTPEPKPTR